MTKLKEAGSPPGARRDTLQADDPAANLLKLMIEYPAREKRDIIGFLQELENAPTRRERRLIFRKHAKDILHINSVAHRALDCDVQATPAQQAKQVLGVELASTGSGFLLGGVVAAFVMGATNSVVAGLWCLIGGAIAGAALPPVLWLADQIPSKVVRAQLKAWREFTKLSVDAIRKRIKAEQRILDSRVKAAQPALRELEAAADGAPGV